MVQPVGERPAFPSPPRGLPIGVTEWASSMVKVLSNLLSETNTRLNRVLPKDGTETMTAPLPLQSVLVAALPTASEHEGEIIYVSDGGSGAVFRGSNGSSWVNLG